MAGPQSRGAIRDAVARQRDRREYWRSSSNAVRAAGGTVGVVGMFGFQGDADVSIACQLLASKLNRLRAWLA